MHKKPVKRRYDFLSISTFISFIAAFLWILPTFGSDYHSVVPSMEVLIIFVVLWSVFSILLLAYFLRIGTTAARKGGIIIFCVMMLIMIVTSYFQYREISALQERLNIIYQKTR